MRVLDRHACRRAIARPNIIGHVWWSPNLSGFGSGAVRVVGRTGRPGPRTVGFALRRPHTPQDQAWTETLSGTLRVNGRTRRRSATPASSTPSLTTRGPSTTPLTQTRLDLWYNDRQREDRIMAYYPAHHTTMPGEHLGMGVQPCATRARYPVHRPRKSGGEGAGTAQVAAARGVRLPSVMAGTGRSCSLRRGPVPGPRSRADRDRSHEGDRWRKSITVDHDLVSR
jgi:hypothetical protein